MEFKILPIIAFLCVAIVVSHAALPSEEYWNTVLPNTPMPKAVKDLLQTTPTATEEWAEDKSTAVGVGKGGVNVNAGKSGGANVNVGGGPSGGAVNVNTPGGTHVNVGGGHSGGSVNVNTPGGTHVNVGGGNGGGGVNVHTPRHKGKPVNVRVSPFKYNYAAAATQLHDDPATALFFLEKDLFAGNKMNLHFSKSTNDETFLPRQLADSIPFSSDKLPEIFTKFAVKPNTAEAAAIKKTIQECEGGAAVKGEEKFCATSLESMIDFSAAVLGKEVSAVSTEADGGGERKAYRVEAVRKLTSEKKAAAAVVCHQQEYEYAVFYCHKTDTTVAYGVSLVGEGGAKAEAVAVCHRDTAEWNPKHLAFQVLKVKPGTVPICHYLPENHIVWVSKN